MRVFEQPWILIAAGLACLVAWCSMFLPYLPTSEGVMGSDYQYFLPQLLAGLYHYTINGPWSVPWFTPAFCGGIPFYPNIQTIYYTLPQWLTFAVGPVAGVQATFVCFAALGLWGMHRLLARSFRARPWVALLGGVLFLFNGFYAYRFLIGHLTFHPFMLAPLTAALLLEEPAIRPKGVFAWLPGPRVLCAALSFAYMFQAGMVHVLPPVLFGLVAMVLAHGLAFGHRPAPYVRMAGAGCLALALCAAKLAAAVAFIKLFPRDMLPLSGYIHIWDGLRVAFESVFVAPAYELDYDVLVNREWYPNQIIALGRHELEYGVTFVPLVLLGLWSGARAARWGAGMWRPRVRASHLAAVGGVCLILALPLLLNWFQPQWNHFLRSLPFFKSSFTMSRWYSLYTLLAVFFGALALDRTWPVGDSASGAGRRVAWTSVLAVCGIAACIAVNGFTDREYYAKQQYLAQPIDEAYQRVERGEQKIVAAFNHVFADEKTGQFVDVIGRNNSLILGASQYRCYEPMFGHRLEQYPWKSLKPGSTLLVQGGVLNAKMPYCMIFPEANQCEPGDQYPVDRALEAQAFLTYHDVPFSMPLAQRIANTLNLAALLVVVGLLLVHGGRAALAVVRGHQLSGQMDGQDVQR